jgi:hypothetical protein
MFGPQHAPAGQSCLNLAQKALRVPPATCHKTTCARMAEINYVCPSACPSRSVMPGLCSESTQSASSCLPHTNMCQNGQNQSCLAHSMPQQVSYDWTGLRKHPECLQLPTKQQHVTKWPKSITFDPEHAKQVSHA